MLNRTIALAAALLLAGNTPVFAQNMASTRPPEALGKISHVVVVYLENRSFNNLFGAYPGVNGIETAIRSGAHIQRDFNGKVYDILPQPHGAGPFDVSDNAADIRAIKLPDLPNMPFAIDRLDPRARTGVNTRDLVHRFYTNRAQINGGRNDLFAAYSDAGGLAMGYYSKDAMEGSQLWRLAKDGVLFDNFFMGAFGGSFLNHIYLVCGCGPAFPAAPDKQRSKLDANGNPVAKPEPAGHWEDNRVTAVQDGDIAINTIQSVFLNNGRQSVLLPPQSAPTIGDRLSDKGIAWAWYSDSFDLATKQDRTEDESKRLQSIERFQWHHQPFAMFARFDPASEQGRQQRSTHLRDGSKLLADIKNGTLPAVSFYKPNGPLNQHPGYAALDRGDALLGQIADALNASPMKDSYLLIVTYDENGGFWDHVAPPSGPKAGDRADFLGPATRIPTIAVSPLLPKGKIDSTEYETGSILKLITERFGLDPLPPRRVQAVNSLAGALAR